MEKGKEFSDLDLVQVSKGALQRRGTDSIKCLVIIIFHVGEVQ